MLSIKKVIGTELLHFEQYFDDSFKSDVGLLNSILTYLAQRKGKQMRPMFVLLCARLGGAINEKSYRAALFVEMLHTSSLVHDDMVDSSLQRRGSFSVNALWKNKAAVLVGDNLFTKSVLLLLEHEDHQILKIFSDSIGKVIEGELLQMERSKKLDLNEDLYYKIIKGKTATLLGGACAAGGASTFTDETSIEKLYAFGEKIGIAFQIKDDLLDYSDDDIGKPIGNDIREKKVTLPLIYTLAHCEPALRRSIKSIIKQKNIQPKDVAFVIAAVKQHGGMDYAAQKMNIFKNEALQILYQFPVSDVRNALEELVAYAIDRKK